MNSRITVDLHENILLETDNYPSTDELIALVCEQPFLIDLNIQQILPQIKKICRRLFWLYSGLKYSVYNRRTYFNRSEDKTFSGRGHC